MGVIAYQCLIGDLPFGGDALGELILRICTGPMPIPSQAGPVPPGFGRMVRPRLLAGPSRAVRDRAQMTDAFRFTDHPHGGPRVRVVLGAHRRIVSARHRARRTGGNRQERSTTQGRGSRGPRRVRTHRSGRCSVSGWGRPHSRSSGSETPIRPSCRRPGAKPRRLSPRRRRLPRKRRTFHPRRARALRSRRSPTSGEARRAGRSNGCRDDGTAASTAAEPRRGASAVHRRNLMGSATNGEGHTDFGF